MYIISIANVVCVSLALCRLVMARAYRLPREEGTQLQYTYPYTCTYQNAYTCTTATDIYYNIIEIVTIFSISLHFDRYTVTCPLLIGVLVCL